MSTTFSSFFSAHHSLHKPFNLKLCSQNSPFYPIHQSQSIQFRLASSKTNPVKLRRTQSLSGFLENHFKVPFHGERISIGGFVKAEKNEGGQTESGVDKAEEDARGMSTMPDRFRPLTKEVPEKPIRWPWFVASAFALYAWRVVLWELYNWKKAVAAIVRFSGYVSKFILAIVFHFIGDPITSLIRGIETSFYTIRAWYSWVIAYAPIPELTTIIILSSIILAISEATVPDSVNNQPYLLMAAGLIGFAAVRSYISELFFWILLVGVFSFARFVKKRDYVSSLMPVATVLAAVGEPWVRMTVIASYLALAIVHHSKQPFEGKEDGDTGVIRRTPVPLLCAALAIGVRLAAKWAGYRHLTWMIA